MNREQLESAVLELVESVAPFDTVPYLLGELSTAELLRIKDAIETELSPVND